MNDELPMSTLGFTAIQGPVDCDAEDCWSKVKLVGSDFEPLHLHNCHGWNYVL